MSFLYATHRVWKTQLYVNTAAILDVEKLRTTRRNQGNISWNSDWAMGFFTHSQLSLITTMMPCKTSDQTWTFFLVFVCLKVCCTAATQLAQQPATFFFTEWAILQNRSYAWWQSVYPHTHKQCKFQDRLTNSILCWGNTCIKYHDSHRHTFFILCKALILY